MKPIGDVATETVARMDTQSLPTKSGSEWRRKMLAMRTRQPPPPIMRRVADIDIPRSAWSAWKEDGKDRLLRRALTPDERDELQRRKQELEPWVCGYDETERSKVAMALTTMFGGFTSMRGSDAEDAATKITSELDFLQEFPAWAITDACLHIRKYGVWRKGAYDMQWPPSDPELRAAVREEVKRRYGDQYENVSRLLTAEVEA